MKALPKKLAEVMAAVNRVPKRGRNDFHHYDYATEADIAEAIRKELADRHVILIPAITSQTREPVGEKGSVLTTLFMSFTFFDGESGEEITRPWLGAGTDKEDKGAYKAMTGGEKYFLLKTFLLPTGDDPETDEGKRAKTDQPVKAADPKTPPLPAKSPTGPVLIQKVDLKKAGNGRVYYEIVLEGGEALMTWNESYGSAAEQYRHNREPVRLQVRGTYKDMGTIVHMMKVEMTTHPEKANCKAAELNADDIPF